MQEFKIGDRVQMTCEMSGRKTDSVGTIIGFTHDRVNTEALVEFDQPSPWMHDGFGNENKRLHGKDGHCWYVHLGRLKLVYQPPSEYHTSFKGRFDGTGIEYNFISVNDNDLCVGDVILDAKYCDQRRNIGGLVVTEICGWVHPSVQQFIEIRGRRIQLARIFINSKKQSTHPRASLPEIQPKEKETEKMRTDFMRRLNFEFGRVDDGRVAFSMKGLAIRTTDGGYNVWDKDGITDVTGLTFDGLPFFKMSTPISQIKTGSVIVHGGVYLHVEGKNDDGSLICVNPAEAARKTVYPVKNIFNFNVITQVCNPFVDMFGIGDATEENPWGNLLTIAMLSGEGGGDKMGMIMAMMATQGGDMGDMSKMMPLMFMMNGRDGGDMGGMMEAMMMMQFMKK